MLKIDCEIITKYNLINIPSIHQNQGKSNIQNFSKEEVSVANFSFIDVQRIFEGNVTFYSDEKVLHKFEQIDLLELLYHLLGVCHNLIVSGVESEFVFPNSDHHLKLTPHKSLPELMSASLFYGNMDDVYFEKSDISLLSFYRSVWNENLKLLNSLYKYKPELFQYFRFTLRHPEALKFANVKLPQCW